MHLSLVVTSTDGLISTNVTRHFHPPQYKRKGLALAPLGHPVLSTLNINSEFFGQPVQSDMKLKPEFLVGGADL